MLLDEDSSHTAQASQALAAQLDCEFLWLPTRSLELNPIEHLWGHAKRNISANRQYDSVDDQARRFVAYLESLPPREALQKVGVLTRRFWLKNVLSKNFCGPA